MKPKLLNRFEPWMALCFSEGSIGGDIESINLHQLEQFYRGPTMLTEADQPGDLELEPRGSNGFAIAPAVSASGHALLLINPHTSFYFRSEMQMVSREGLDAYGAVTWGQFFVYQGFNDRIGWMHTSGGGNVITEYLETVTRKSGSYSYRYGDGEKPLRTMPITLRYKHGDGMAERIVTAYYSHHGPIVREADGKWVAVRLMQEPMKALMQSYTRTKARSYAEFYKAMELRTNSSNNTVYADADGNIAYFHGNFMPIRHTRFDWHHPVDGSDPATEWKGLHEVKDTITLLNPKNGWIQNTNNWPFSAAGAYSPRREDYPDYMWVYPENARGLHAVRVLENQKDFTLDSLIEAANDNYLTGFEALIPSLLSAYDEAAPTDPLKTQLEEQVKTLRSWDLRYAVSSVPTALAINWGQDLMGHVSGTAKGQGVPLLEYMASLTSGQERLQALARASSKLEQDFGSWKTPWGEINRFQRLSGAIVPNYDDAKPSLPVAFTSSVWGSLAAFGASAPGETKRIYGDRGNSFEAVVEFGPRIKAKSLLAGGESGDPASPHFTDQAERYTKSEFKDVLFYREDVEKQLERKYHPGN